MKHNLTFYVRVQDIFSMTPGACLASRIIPATATHAIEIPESFPCGRAVHRSSHTLTNGQTKLSDIVTLIAVCADTGG